MNKYLHKKILKLAFHPVSRLSKKITASWNPVDMKTGNPLQVLTDAMAYNATVQINYKNSGWRTILPYGWNSSKDGNILLMCYKNTGEIRSYRMDKIYDLLIDDSLLENMPGDRPEEPKMHMSFNDFQIPTLPNLDEIIDETEAETKEELPYDAGLKALTSNEIEENVEPVNTINDDEEDQEIPSEEENDEEIPSEEENENEDEEENLDFDTDFDIGEEDTEEESDEKEEKDTEEKTDTEEENLDDIAALLGGEKK